MNLKSLLTKGLNTNAHTPLDWFPHSSRGCFGDGNIYGYPLYSVARMGIDI